VTQFGDDVLKVRSMPLDPYRHRRQSMLSVLQELCGNVAVLIDAGPSTEFTMEFGFVLPKIAQFPYRLCVSIWTRRLRFLHCCSEPLEMTQDQHTTTKQFLVGTGMQRTDDFRKFARFKLLKRNLFFNRAVVVPLSVGRGCFPPKRRSK
jgi:hypothetical protein